MMVPQKVVLSELHFLCNEEAPAEVELGPFMQGLVVDRDPAWSGPCLLDVASGRTLVVLGETGNVIVKDDHLVSNGPRPVPDIYTRLFIQTYTDKEAP